MQANKTGWIRTEFGQNADWQGRGVGAIDAVIRQHLKTFFDHLFLEVDVLKDRLNDNIRAFVIGVRVSRRDQIQQPVFALLRHAFALDALVGQRVGIGFALRGILDRDILQNGLKPLIGLRPGNTRPHHASAQNSGFLELGRRTLWADLAGFHGLHAKEEGLNRSLCLG